jgi:chromosome segregation ATPase
MQTHGEELQTAKTQNTTLVQQVDETNQALTANMTEFQTSLAQFKETLTSLGTNIGQVQNDLTAQRQELGTVQIRTEELSGSMEQVQGAIGNSGTLFSTRLKEQSGQIAELQKQVTILQDKLNADTQALRAYLEQDVKTAMAQLVNDIDKHQEPVFGRIESLQKDMETLGTHVQADAAHVQDLSQSVLKLREAQEVMGSLLGKRGDEIIQQAGRLSERMNTVESHQTALTEQIQSAGQLTDQLRQTGDQISSRLQDLEIHRSGLVGKLDSDAQVTNTHLQEVNNGIKSVAQALENVSSKLNTRIDAQEQRLNRAMTSFQKVQGTAEASQANLAHLNQLTETVNKLRDVVNTIGTKLGERVDQHEDRLGQLAQRVNRLQIPQKPK